MSRRERGTGSFCENSDGSYTFRKVVGYKADGRRKTLTVSAVTKNKCYQLMKKKEDQWKTEQKKTHTTIYTTVSELCLMHLHYQQRSEELTEKSYDRRETTIMRHIHDYPIGQIIADDLSATDVEDHISTLIGSGHLSASSIKKVVDVLNAAYTWAYDNSELSKNPIKAIKSSLMKRIARIEHRSENDADVIVLSESEQKRLESYAYSETVSIKRGELFQLYDLLLLKTGLRVGELCACRWRDYNSETKVLTIRRSQVVVKNRDRSNENSPHTIRIEKGTKNQKARNIELFDDAVMVLEKIRSLSRWNSPDDFIAVTRTGCAHTATSLAARTRTVFRNAGIYLGENETGATHIFRRTFATNCYNAGIPIKSIAAYMGDLESTVLKHYIAAREKIISRDNVITRVVRLHSPIGNTQETD